MSPKAVSHIIPVTVHVRGVLKSELPVLLTGAEVFILDDVSLPDQVRSGFKFSRSIIQGYKIIAQGSTGADGRATFDIRLDTDQNDYVAVAAFHSEEIMAAETFALNQYNKREDVTINLRMTDGFDFVIGPPDDSVSDQTVMLPFAKSTRFKLRWPSDPEFNNVQPSLFVSRDRVTPGRKKIQEGGGLAREFHYSSDRAGPVDFVAAFATGQEPPIGFHYSLDKTADGIVSPPEPSVITGGLTVSMQRSSSIATDDISVGPKIRRSTDALLFKNYFDFMDWVFCGDPLGNGNPMDRNRTRESLARTTRRRALPFTDTDAYRNIKVATEAFVLANCGFLGDVNDFTQDDADFITNRVVVPASIGDLATWLGRYLEYDSQAQTGLLPYLAVIRRKMADEPIKQTDIGDVDLELDPNEFHEQVSRCYGILRSRLAQPCLLELIWSYWQEEGMLVQAMNSITRRFQNIRGPMNNDPLANMEVDPLRPLNNLLWGYIQDEQHRLSVVRRNYEYDHHYGLRLSGKAVNNMRPADSRSKFLEAFHTLLSVVSRFYRLDDDTTVKADAFPVLNALKEAHLILSQGAHNQFGDLPSTARIEMLMQQWILARPEFREFLPTRIMVAYPEPWMDRVDAMKKLQGWSDTSSLHFRNLAIFGEQVLLSVRFGNWADINDPYSALNWARYWRSEIQGYLHAYRSATGIDLSLDIQNARIDATMPSVHLVRRLNEQQRLV